MEDFIGSQVETEIGSTYINAQDDSPVRTCIIDMGHPQSPTKLQIDNITTEVLSKVTLKQKI